MRHSLAGLYAFCVTAALFASAAVGAEGPASGRARSVRLRLEWGGSRSHVWNGLLEVDEGRFEDPVSLGVEAGDPGTVWRDRGGVWIQRRSPRVYDGLDVTVTAAPQSRLTLTLQAVGPNSLHDQFTFTPADLIARGRTLRVADSDVRLAIQPRPGDALRLRLDRSHLIFRPGSRFRATVVPRVAEVDNGTKAGRIAWRITPARSDEALDRGSRDVTGGDGSTDPPEVPLDLPLPDEEGVYDIHLALTAPEVPKTTRQVQVVVLADTAPDAATETGGRASRKLVDEFEAGSNRSFLHRVRRPDFGHNRFEWGVEQVGTSMRRLLAPVFSATSTTANDAEGETAWTAYRLDLERTGRPHLVAVSAASGLDGGLGVSLLEPNAAGQLMPVGLNTGFYADPAGPLSVSSGRDQSPESTTQHEVLFWPKVRRPVLLLHRLHGAEPLESITVRVYEIPLDGAGEDEARSSRTEHRLVGPYMHKPLLPENFGASQALDADSGRSLDDWLTFYEASRRLVKYLEDAGCNSLMLAVLADGSTIYPSRHLQPTPRYDTGTYFSTGQDPQRKDVLELLFRLFDRQGLTLIPQLQFSTPLPELERTLARGSERTRGIELIGRDGRSWREARGTARGPAPCYNPLDPRVQQAVLNVVRELVGRYRHHPSFSAVAVELSSVGYLQLPGLAWGYDDATIARFEKDTGVRVPAGEGESRYRRRYEFLTSRARRKWIAWRCRQLAAFHRRLAEATAAAGKGQRLILSGNRILRGSRPDDDLDRALRAGRRLETLLAVKGLDFSQYSADGRLTVLRPALWRIPANGTNPLLDRTLNTGGPLDEVFALPGAGSLFYHLPRQYRIEEFDARSPWQPAYTWLAVQAGPAGPANRRRYAHALAAGDAQMIFDGSWMIPLGREDALRRMRRSIRSLPAIPFHKTSQQQQPVVVRIARKGEKTWLYAVNDFPQPVTVKLRLSSPPGTSCRITGRENHGRQTTSAAPGTKAGSGLSASLKGYGIWACRVDDPQAHLRDLEVELPESSLAALRGQIDAFEEKLSRVRSENGTESRAIENAGFERAAPRQQSVPGWEFPVQNAAFWEVDRGQSRSGKSSLMLAATADRAGVLTTPLSLSGQRHLTLSVWLRSDRDGMAVRLAFEAEMDGRRRVQSARVEADSEWRRYVLRVREIPRGNLTDPRIRIEMRGPGRLWVDDVQVRARRIAPDAQRQLMKVFSAANFAWEEGRYADCHHLLQSYWGQYLFTGSRPQDEASGAETDAKSPGVLAPLQRFLR